MTRSDFQEKEQKKHAGETPAGRKGKMPSPHGLTIVELLVTMAVMSMIMATTLVILTRLSRSLAAAPQEAANAALADPVRALMTTDLMNATAYIPTSTGFRLKTTASLDETSLELRQLPTIVEYRVETVGSRNWLTRIQSALLLRPDFRTLVCSGVDSVQLAPGPSPEGADSPEAAEKWRELPQEVALTVVWDEGAGTMEFALQKN
jgi:prepilin-type N-terminal cleavage/methylation domain-containing protein